MIRKKQPENTNHQSVLIILALLLVTLACTLPIFGPGIDPEINLPPDSEEGIATYQAELTATLVALETIIADTTAIAAANAQSTPTPLGENDLEGFCGIYREFVDELTARIEDYSVNIGEGKDPGDRAEQADHAIEVYIDQLLIPAPSEIRPAVEQISAMSLMGLLSSPDPMPEAQALLDQIDTYAADNCGISLKDNEHSKQAPEVSLGPLAVCGRVLITSSCHSERPHGAKKLLHTNQLFATTVPYECYFGCILAQLSVY